MRRRGSIPGRQGEIQTRAELVAAQRNRRLRQDEQLERLFLQRVEQLEARIAELEQSIADINARGADQGGSPQVNGST